MPQGLLPRAASSSPAQLPKPMLQWAAAVLYTDHCRVPRSCKSHTGGQGAQKERSFQCLQRASRMHLDRDRKATKKRTRLAEWQRQCVLQALSDVAGVMAGYSVPGTPGAGLGRRHRPPRCRGSPSVLHPWTPPSSCSVTACKTQEKQHKTQRRGAQKRAPPSSCRGSQPAGDRHSGARGTERGSLCRRCISSEPQSATSRNKASCNNVGSARDNDRSMARERACRAGRGALQGW